MRPARRVLALLFAAGLLTACTDKPGAEDPLQLTDNPVAATPAKSPPTTEDPAGKVRDGAAPEPAARTAKLGDRTLVARGKDGLEVRRNGAVEKTIKGELAGADQVFVADGNVAVLDRVRSAVFVIDVDDGTVGLGLRAGQGATNAATDEFGRLLVVDTRRGALLAFSLDPLVLRQRYPVPGAPYGIAYDADRDLAWVTLTETNEVVGFDVAGEEPRERDRFATVRQPNSVTVERQTGEVLVASAAGEGIQVIEP